MEKRWRPPFYLALSCAVCVCRCVCVCVPLCLSAVFVSLCVCLTLSVSLSVSSTHYNALLVLKAPGHRAGTALAFPTPSNVSKPSTHFLIPQLGRRRSVAPVPIRKHDVTIGRTRAHEAERKR